MARPLGSAQEVVLELMLVHKMWFQPSPGPPYECFVFVTPSETKRVLESLIRRGLAYKAAAVGVYFLTPKGKEAARVLCIT